ncbi:MAG: hypothetical protein ACP5NI_04145 [Acetobacteraceae bacterium]
MRFSPRLMAPGASFALALLAAAPSPAAAQAVFAAPLGGAQLAPQLMVPQPAPLPQPLSGPLLVTPWSPPVLAAPVPARPVAAQPVAARPIAVSPGSAP